MTTLKDIDVIMQGIFRGIVNDPWPMAVGFEFKRNRYLYKVCGPSSLHYAAFRPPMPPRPDRIDISKL